MIEWMVAGLGLVLLCGSLGFLFYKAFYVEKSEPVIVFEIEKMVPQGGGVLVVAKVENRGGKTVTALQILGKTVDQEHEVVIDYLPARSERGFGMFFQKNLSADEVKFEAGAFQQP